MRYHIMIVESDEGYSGQCVELPGAISEGDTTEALMKNMKEAIGLVQESMQEWANANSATILELPIESH